MKIGMTGSREGITMEALSSFRNYILSIQIKEVNHGDCVGADTIFHNINTFGSCCKSNHILLPKEYLVRNRDIVDQTEILIAFSFDNERSNKIRYSEYNKICSESK